MSVNAAVDVGNFDHLGVYLSGKDIKKENFFEAFCNAVAESKEKKGIIGFEAPLFIPASSIKGIGTIRTGFDKSRHSCDIDRKKCVWHSPVGAGVTIRGIVLLKLLFDQITKTKTIKNISIFTDYSEFQRTQSGILVYEAFVNGKGTPSSVIPESFLRQDDHDQDAALSAFLFSQTRDIKTIFTDSYINLPAVLATSAGLDVSSKKSGFIVRTYKPENHLYDERVDYFNVKWE